MLTNSNISYGVADPVHRNMDSEIQPRRTRSLRLLVVFLVLEDDDVLQSRKTKRPQIF